MLELKEILELFPDVETKKILISSYAKTQKENSELSNEVFAQLLYLKKIYPNITIKVNKYSNELSNFSFDEGKLEINLNGLVSLTTFFHELTHLFSYIFSMYSIPTEYLNLKNNVLLSQVNYSNLILFLNLCKSNKQKLLSEDKASENISHNVQGIESGDFITDSSVGQYNIISCMEDIIDALVEGKSFDDGLTFIKNNQSLAMKSSRSAGHGCDYYKKTGYEFEEIIANYQAIKLVDPNNSLFEVLKQILGHEFISFLDSRCQLINGAEVKIYEQNNNIARK